MNIFTNDDIDFSKDFYKYLNESYDKHIQEKLLKQKNNEIIKKNIENLEKCIKQNLNDDNTQPFDRTFSCGNFYSLLKNNNDKLETDKDVNIEQFKKPLSKINLIKSDIISDNKPDFCSNYGGGNLYGSYSYESDIIPKNSYNYLTNNHSILIIRMSNNTEHTNSYNVTYRVYRE